jgi:dTDP-4-dehydrorhamnose 3,5-epimerase
MAIPDVLVIEPKVHGDARGFFFESYSERDFAAATGLKPKFVQDNHSRSATGVLRGLHYQIRNAQDKLVRVAAGEIFDVAVDMRRASPTFGRWVGVTLSAENKKQLWVPAGFAHGFLSMRDGTEVLYKTTDFYSPEHERSLLWNDAAIGIEWPLSGATPQLAAKDAAGKLLADAEVF